MVVEAEATTTSAPSTLSSTVTTTQTQRPLTLFNPNSNNNTIFNTVAPITQAQRLSTTQRITFNQQTTLSLFQTQPTSTTISTAAVTLSTQPTPQTVRTTTATPSTPTAVVLSTQSFTRPQQTTPSTCNYVQTCDQIVTGRNLNYGRVLRIIQDEEYLSKADTDIIRRNFIASQSEDFLYHQHLNEFPNDDYEVFD